MSSSLENLTFLVVEDEYFIADDIVTALKKFGARVVGPVSTLADAHALLRSVDTLSGAILDINLHGEASYSLAEELDRRRIPYIFATGYEQSDIPARFGHVPRWGKPYESEDLALSWASRHRYAGKEPELGY